jgi:hypothetical protein
MNTGIQTLISSIVGVVLGGFLGAVAGIFLPMGQGMGSLAIGSLIGAVLGGITMIGLRWRTKEGGATGTPQPSAIREVALWMAMGFVVAYFVGALKMNLFDYHEMLGSTIFSVVIGTVIGMGMMVGLGVWHIKQPFSYKRAILGCSLGMALQPFLPMVLNAGEMLMGVVFGAGSLILVRTMWQWVRDEPYGKVVIGLLILLLTGGYVGLGRMMLDNMAANGGVVVFPDSVALLQLGFVPIMGIPLMMYGLSWLTQSSADATAQNV